MFIRVYNYNTMDKVKAFEAHTDYIRQANNHRTSPSSQSGCPATKSQVALLIHLTLQQSQLRLL